MANAPYPDIAADDATSVVFAIPIVGGKPLSADNPLPTSGGGGDGGGGTGGGTSSGTVTPVMTSGGATAVLTPNQVNVFAAFPDQACRQLTVANTTGVQIEVQQGGAGAAFPVFPGTYFTFYGITNANQLAVRRSDLSTNQVAVIVRYEG
jgi:hypothetical protein